MSKLLVKMPRVPYSPPRLTIYGGLKELTASGSGTAVEGTTGGGGCTGQTDRDFC